MLVSLVRWSLSDWKPFSAYLEREEDCEREKEENEGNIGGLLATHCGSLEDARPCSV